MFLILSTADQLDPFHKKLSGIVNKLLHILKDTSKGIENFLSKIEALKTLEKIAEKLLLSGGKFLIKEKQKQHVLDALRK